MKISTLIGIFGFLLLTTLQGNAQKKRFNPKQRFHAGLFLGVNAAQISGDRVTGYDKWGLMAGLRGVAVITRKMNVSMELIYNQKGTKVEYVGAITNQVGRILELNYAEVPVLLQIDLTPQKKEGQVPFNLETGFSFARLIQTNVTENANWTTLNFTSIADDFKKSEWNYILGVNVRILPNTRLGLRTSVAFTKVYINKNPEEKNPALNLFNPEEPYRFFRNYHLTLYASYELY